MKAVLIGNHDLVIYNFRLELIEALLSEGYEVVVLCPYGDKIKNLKELGCEYYEIEMSRHGTNPIAELKLLRSYKRLLQYISPDVVLTFTIKPNIYGGLACSRLNIPFAVNITGLGTAINNGGIMQKFTTFLYRKALKRCNVCFFQNSDNMEFFLRRNIVKGKYTLLPGSGVNLARNNLEDYPDSLPIKFLFVGRLMKDKGYSEYVMVAREAIKNGLNAEFHSIGACEKEYEITLKDLSADKYVKWHGPVDDVHEYMKNCHAIVLPSYHEGMANVLLEAAATGRPVIATDIPGCRETFDKDISGLACEPRDVDSLYNAMLKFLNMTFEERRQMGLCGRKKVENEFDRKIVVDAYLQQIQSILR